MMKSIILICITAMLCTTLYVYEQRDNTARIVKLEKQNKELQDRVNVLQFNFDMCKFLMNRPVE